MVGTHTQIYSAEAARSDLAVESVAVTNGDDELLETV
jgi:hypothetical protein